MSFKAEGSHLGPAVASLAPMLAANTRLVVLSLESVGGTPRDFAALGQALESNAASSLAAC